MYHVYIVRCADGTLYSGIAINLLQRIAQHNGVGSRGAKYTRGRRPVNLVYQEKCQTRSQALRREQKIKSMTKIQKEALL